MIGNEFLTEVCQKDLSTDIEKINKMLDEDNIFVVIDIETTGLSSDARIFKLEAAKIKDGKEIERFNTLVNPHTRLTTKIEELTGISNDALKDAPDIEKILPDFFDFIGDHLLVLQHPKYILGFLEKEMKNTDRNILNSFVDIRELSVLKNPDFRYGPHSKLKTLLPSDFDFNDYIRMVYEIFFKLLRDENSNLCVTNAPREEPTTEA